MKRQKVNLEFYSSGPTGSLGYEICVATAQILKELHPWIDGSWEAMPLPDLVYALDALPPERKKHAFQGNMPSMDFPMARQGVATRYDRKFTDLKFLCTVNITGRGLLTYNQEIKTPRDLIGKRIATYPPTSSMRVLSDAILRDGWGIYDQVELKVYEQRRLKEALLGGDIDAAFFAQAWEASEGKWDTPGFVAEILEAKKTCWLSISQEDADRVGRKNAWQLLRMLVPKGALPGRDNPPEDVALPAYASAIVAWDITEEEVAYELVKLLAENAESWSKHTNTPLYPDRLSQFPGLTEDMVHPGALRYYNEHNIKIGG